MSDLWEVRKVTDFVGAGRPQDLAKSVKLTDAQWQEWLKLQKAALQFGAAFLHQGFRTNKGKDLFFVNAMAFVRTFMAAPERPLRATKRKTKRGAGR